MFENGVIFSVRTTVHGTIVWDTGDILATTESARILFEDQQASFFAQIHFIWLPSAHGNEESQKQS